LQFDKDLPIANVMVDLSVKTRTPVYINGLYYVLSSTLIQVIAETTGSLTEIEAPDDLHAATLTISLDNTSLRISPMDHTFAKIASPDSAYKTRDTQFPSQTVAGGIMGSPNHRTLLEPAPTDDTVSAVVQNLAALKGAYASIQNPGEKISAIQASASMHRDHRPVAPAMLQANHPYATNFLSWGDIGHALGDAADKVGKVLDDVIHTLGMLRTLLETLSVPPPVACSSR
jgi:hypothetical protein